MSVQAHFQITGRALKRWFIAQCVDSALVGLLWLAGLLILGVPWAPLWALLAMLFQFIPHIGGVLTLLGPLGATLLAGKGGEGALYLLGLYAVVMVVDGLLIQPILLRRASKVPVWASILVPLIMGYFFSFWGVLASAPLLAIFFALKSHRREMRELPPVEVIPPDISEPHRDRSVPPTVIEG
jgi:predicted PurR-regulated permease PerM